MIDDLNVSGSARQFAAVAEPARTLAPRLGRAAAVTALLLVVTGCTATPSEPAPTSSSAATPMVIDLHQVRDELGAPPSEAAEDTDRRDRIYQHQVDSQWAEVLRRFPSAVRPTLPAPTYVDQTEQGLLINDCLTASGFDPVTVDPFGAVPWTSPAADEGAVVAYFDCYAHYPVSSGTPSDEQLGYAYDYYTLYLQPCYVSHGIAVEPAISREQYIAEWPYQNWYPSTGDAVLDEDETLLLNRDCPPQPLGLH